MLVILCVNAFPSLSLRLQYLLDDNEIKIKTALWMAENSDYLKEQKGVRASVCESNDRKTQ